MRLPGSFINTVQPATMSSRDAAKCSAAEENSPMQQQCRQGCKRLDRSECGCGSKTRCVYVYVDLGETVLKMAAFLFPQLEGDGEQRRFEDGKMRYLQNKAKRLADKERQQ